MNIFTKSIVSLFKIIVLVALAYLLIGLFFAKNNYQLAIGIFVLIFVTLPTIFLFFFKKKFLSKYPKFNILWKIICVIYIISIILYISVTIFGTWHLGVDAKTQKTIDFINSQKITLNDVMGKNLPPDPDQKINDSTIGGIDDNKNNIRDDVEMAIFREYPNSARIRAAELQYAQALQLELTQVFNSQTLVPVMQKEDLAYKCIGDIVDSRSVSAKGGLVALDQKDKEISDLILNTDLRKKQYSDILGKYMTGYASSSNNDCNIELSSLPN